MSAVPVPPADLRGKLALVDLATPARSPIARTVALSLWAEPRMANTMSGEEWRREQAVTRWLRRRPGLSR